jgi:VWFA-related protein
MSGGFQNLSRVGFACCFLLLTPGALRTQETTEPVSPESIRVDVRQVLVPVVVTDRRGHHITGLKANEFRVFEDGVEQKVVWFGTELRDAGPPPQVEQPAAAEPRAGLEEPAQESPAPTRRTYLVCLDTLNVAFENFNGIRTALRKVFQEERSTDSHYALVALDRKLSIIRKATRNLEDIFAAIETGEVDRTLVASAGVGLAMQERELVRMLEDYCERCSCGTAVPGQRTVMRDLTSCESLLNGIKIWAANAALERTVLERNLLRQLRSIVEELGKQPGKRILVFVSDGFNIRSGRELFALIAAYLGEPSIVMENPGESLGPELEEVIKLATERDVVIYALDSQGLPPATLGVFDAERRRSFARSPNPHALSDVLLARSSLADEKKDAMVEMAAATGGVFVHNTNDLARGLRQAFADGREYYVLAYVPTNRAEDGRFREIRVEVKNNRWRVRSKRGYWAPVAAAVAAAPPGP